jgi:hypothetical protein
MVQLSSAGGGGSVSAPQRAETTWCVGTKSLVRVDIAGVIGWFDAEGNAVVPLLADLSTATAGACPITTGAALNEQHAVVVEVGCDGVVPSTRTTIRNYQNGVLQSTNITYTDSAGTTIVPTASWTIGPCPITPPVPPIHSAFEDSTVCAGGTSYIRRVTKTFNTLGVELTEVVTFHDSANAIVLTPATYYFGSCEVSTSAIVNAVKSEVRTGVVPFDFATELSGANLISFTVILTNGGTIDTGNGPTTFPPGSYSWSAESGATISTEPEIIPTNGAIILWTQR